MRIRIPTLFLAAGILLLPSPVSAILIETGGKRIGGYLVSDDGKLVTIRIKADGKEKVEAFERTKIKIVHKVDLPRLGKLAKDMPIAYREYAEELADAKGDPEATELALRLFLIAAYLDTPKLGPSCLLNMAALATRPADVRRFRAMAFLVDAKADKSVLTIEGGQASPSALPKTKAARAALDYFRKALRQFRNGQFKEAQANAEVGAVAICFTTAPGMLDQKSFVQACKDAMVNKETAEDHLETVLRGEIWALDQLITESLTAKGAGDGWGRALNEGEFTPLPLLTLETITEFDPRKCVFRKGKWVEP